MKAIRSYLVGQFRRPSGPLGHLAGYVMSLRPSNVDRNRWTVELLHLAPGARVLELGYGPGIGIEAALRAAPSVQVVGLDHSAAMRTTARRRNADAVRSGQVQLLVGDAENPPPDLGLFDAIFSSNVWLFWSDPDATITRLSRLLAPRGRLAITHLPRFAGAGRADSDAAADLIESQMSRAGLTQLDRAYLDLDPIPAVCVVGRRSTPEAA